MMGILENSLLGCFPNMIMFTLNLIFLALEAYIYFGYMIYMLCLISEIEGVVCIAFHLGCCGGDHTCT